MIFGFRANVTFEAENLDDAFAKLSEHFMALLDSEGSIAQPLTFLSGELFIDPVPPNLAKVSAR